MIKQLLSFKSGFKGVWYTIKSESHMRFHMVAGFYVLLFSLFYEFSVSQTALLILLIASVMFAEIINTCLEELCNLVADRYEPIVKIVKDMAAGAVLVLSIASAIIAIIFYWNVPVIMQILSYFAKNIFMLVLLIISAVISVIFVALGPTGIKTVFLRLKFKNKN